MKNAAFCCLGILSSVACAAPGGTEGALPEMPAAFRAAPEAVVAAAAAVTAARYPDADCVTVDDRLHTAYEPDGAYVAWDDEWVKILTEKGRRANAAVTVDFNERYGAAAVQCVELIGPDGTVRPVDFARTLKTATDNASLAANIVDPLHKKTTCAVPGLAVGDIRHVRWCRRVHKPRMKGTFADLSLLEYTAPVVSTVVTVDQPDALPVRHAVLRHPCGATVTRAPDAPLAPGRTLLKWTARDVPQVFPEPRMPPLTRCAQTLWLSTAPDWPAVSRWYWSMCERHLAAATPAMTNAVADLTRGCPDADAKIRALYRFVSQEVRYMGLTLETDAPGYEPHDVNITFENRYGVCRDKAALLAALLRIAGLPAWPVLIHAGAKMDPEVPLPYFNHAITAVETADGGYRLMDATDESSRDLMPSYLSDRSYLVARPDGENLRTSPVVPVAENTLAVASDGVFSPDGDLLLTTRFTFDGINDTALRHSLVRKTDTERRRAFEGFLRAAAPGAELLSLELAPADLHDTDTRLTAKTVTRLPDALLRGDTRDTVHLPFLTRHLSVAAAMLDENTALETRRFPLVLRTTAGTRETLSLTLGDALGAPLHLPPDAAVTNAPGYAFTLSHAVTGGVLRATRDLAVTGVHFATNAYTALRAARQATETAERGDPVFHVQANANAHVRHRLYETVLHFQSPTRWISTNTVEKEILDYSGKKSAAELAFTYNPCVQSVEIVSATVSNRNGVVHRVTPKEINVMDGGWTAAAPRYPAEKKLVVNLPSVEIGSVIRTVVARTVTNAPTAYTTVYTFGGRDPMEREILEFHVPAGMPFAVRADNLPPAAPTNGVCRWEMTDVPRTPDEPAQPPGRFWRPTVSVSAADWRATGRALTDALAAARRAGDAAARRQGRVLAAAHATPGETVRAAREFLAHRLRVRGPSLFALPFDRAFTPPDRVLAEGYGSSPDRLNLLFALLDGAGFRCSFVLAADDSRGFSLSDDERRAIPRPTSFGALLLRADGADGRTYWVGGENEYTPPETSAHDGDSFYDPAADAFGRISCPSSVAAPAHWWAPWTWFGGADAAPDDTADNDAVWGDRSESVCRLTVRANGAVDFDVRNRLWGAGVGGFRKRYAELLPEPRARHYQELLGNLAQNATATSDLQTDVTGYPAALAFSAYAADYAVAQGDALTVKIPDFTGSLFAVGSARREAPVAVSGKAATEDIYEIVFPEGYTRADALPPDLTLCNPHDANDVWLEQTTDCRTADDRLHVTVRRCVRRPHAAILSPDYAAFLRDWNRRAASAAARTVTATK